MVNKLGLVALLLGIISSIVACVQVSLAILTVNANDVKQQANFLSVLALSDGRIGGKKTVKTIEKATSSPAILGSSRVYCLPEPFCEFV